VANPRRDRRLTRGERNCQWIEANCRIPEGKLVGQPVKLTAQQREWICAIYDTPTRRFILSMGRKNAKTALSAFLLLLHLVGPEARENSQLYSAAQSRDQAAVLFNLAAKVVRFSPDLATYVQIRESAKSLVCPEIGTVYRALSADASTAMGLSPVFVVHDELGQTRGPRSELYEALETASAAQESPLTIIISTQAPTDADLLSVLIDDALKGGDPRTKVVLYTADEALDPFSEEAIRQANPHFDVFMNRDEVFDQANAAKRMPSAEAGYRNLILNQRIDPTAMFVSRSVWESNGEAPRDLREAQGVRRARPVQRVRLHRLVLIGEQGGAVGRGADLLAARARADGEVAAGPRALRRVAPRRAAAGDPGRVDQLRLRGALPARRVQPLRRAGAGVRPLQHEVPAALPRAGRIHREGAGAVRGVRAGHGVHVSGAP
jgi:hypothetical protein